MTENTDHFPLLGILISGGWTMLPLALCSVAAVAIIIERLFWGLRREKVLPPELYNQISELLKLKRYDELLGICRVSSSSLARIAGAAIRNLGKPREIILTATEAAGRREALTLQKYLGALGTIATVAPLLGLLGTVSGMIKTFDVIQTTGVGQAQALAGGISEALISTAAGLTVAVPALFFYRYFVVKTKTLVSEMEGIALEVLDEVSAS